MIVKCMVCQRIAGVRGTERGETSGICPQCFDMLMERRRTKKELARIRRKYEQIELIVQNRQQ